jgi:hypothetical protein
LPKKQCFLAFIYGKSLFPFEETGFFSEGKGDSVMRSNMKSRHLLSGLLASLIVLFSVNSLFAASAVLSWDPPTTNEDGTSLDDLAGYKVYYGTSSGNYSTTIDVGNVVTYEVTNLTAGATYYFATAAYDTSGNESGYSAEVSKAFPVPDTAPPVISGVQTAGITDSTVTVSWTTDELSDTRVQYGLTTSYGTTTALDSSMVTSHSQSINGLANSTLYHYRVISRDAAGNESVSNDYIFTTAALPEQVDYYCDTDNDGYAGTAVYGSCAGAGCEPAGCQTSPGSDCNDSDAGISPDAADDTCDGIDDNCDGALDNNYVVTASSCGEGVCSSTGQLICSSGSVVDTCTAGNPTGADADCNGIDEDCDGIPDNNYVISFISCGTGVCSSVGQLECQEGEEVNSCIPGIPAEDSETTCGDDLDNDCDGQVDEDCYPDIDVSRVLLSEDFSAGIPAAWTREGTWNTDNNCGRTIGYPFEGAYAIADSSCDTTGAEELATQVFDTASCDTVTLDFSNQYYWYSGNLEVNVSGDGGVTWENSISVGADDGYPVPNWKEIDISSVAGLSEAQVKFRYVNDTVDGFWALDNLWVTCKSDQVQFYAQVEDTLLKTVMVTNRGGDDLAIDMLNVEGADASDFSIGENEDCTNQTLLPGESCAVDIIFAPLTSGAKSANIIISSNDPDTPALSVSLNGRGTDIVNTEIVNPIPVIKVNGLSGAVNVARGSNVRAEIELDPGSLNGRDADWWVLMEYRGRWYYYDEYSGKWRRGYSDFREGPLTETGPVEVLSSTRLSRGRYTMYFGIDSEMNGVQDPDVYYYDSVIVDVK